MFAIDRVAAFSSRGHAAYPMSFFLRMKDSRQVLIDADKQPLERLDVDLCIVGAGAAGIAIAHRLLGSGLRVALLESGGLAHEDATQDLYAGDSVGHPMEMDVGRYRILGGSTSRWTGRCAPLDPIDFAARDWVPHSGWPITFAGVDAYYPAAQIICGFREPWPQPAGAVRGHLNGLKDEPDSFIWRFPRSADQARLDFGRTFRAALEADPDTIVVQHANVTAIETSATTRVHAIRAETLAGAALHVVARAHVLCCGGIENARLLLDSAEDPGQALGNAHDLVGRFFMQHPRGITATMSPTAAQARALQQRFNLFAARHAAQHEVGFTLTERQQRDRGLLNASAVLRYEAADSSGWEALKRLRARLQQRRLGSDALRGAIRGAVGEALRLAADPLDVAANAWRLARGRQTGFLRPRVSIVVDLEQSPDPDSRVTLSRRRDRLGRRQASVDWRISPLERRTARALTELVGNSLSRHSLGETRLAAWLSETGPYVGRELLRTHHHIGTTRMAADPREGVVDADCRVHGTENLFVAGCSVFPTGGHANPTLTIVALALRLADHLRATLNISAPALMPELLPAQ